MLWDSASHITHTAVTNFHRVSVKYLVQVRCWWEMFVNQGKKVAPIFDLTFLLNGGLYQIMFLRLFLSLFGLFEEASFSGLYLSVASKLLRLRASTYNTNAAP